MVLCIQSFRASNIDNFHADYMNSQGHFLQRDISAQADLAVRHYRETTPVAERSATEIWNVMTKAQERTIKSIRARSFEKYISVAHPDNGEDFFHEVLFWTQITLERNSSKSLFNSITLLNSNHFYFVYRLTAILMSSLRRTWQLKNCKKLSHARSKLRSKLSGFTGGTPPFVKG